MVENPVLRRRMSGAVKRDFRPESRKGTLEDRKDTVLLLTEALELDVEIYVEIRSSATG